MTAIPDIPSGAHGPRQLVHVLVGGVPLLEPRDGEYLPPCRYQAVGRCRHLVRDGLVELLQIIAGDRRVHVMLGVVIHLEIQVAKERVDLDGAAAETEIGHVVLQADVLRDVADPLEAAP